jgi:hypothetical protein
LLEGDESQAGQQCHCPTCGMLFIIPQPLVSPAGGCGGPFRFSERFEGLEGGSQPTAAAASDPSAPFVPESHAAVAAPASPMAAPPEPELLHIPCPNGHELETPVEMLEQEVLCPHCNAQFRLRRKDSVEFKKKKEQEEALRLEKVGRLWLNWAIVAIVLVVLIFIGLIAYSTMNQPTGLEAK